MVFILTLIVGYEDIYGYNYPVATYLPLVVMLSITLSFNIQKSEHWFVHMMHQKVSLLMKQL